jgi:hypothetical protein
MKFCWHCSNPSLGTWDVKWGVGVFMRAFNDGRFLETEIKLLEEGKGMTWGFALGKIKTKSRLRINEHDEWTELHEITMGSEPPKKLMELAVRREE